MKLLRKFYIFIILDLLTFICWGLALSPYNILWKPGPIDNQSGAFFLCLLMLYILIPASVVSLIFFLFVYKNYRSFADFSIAMALNLHAFITIIIFIVYYW